MVILLEKSSKIKKSSKDETGVKNLAESKSPKLTEEAFLSFLSFFFLFHVE